MKIYGHNKEAYASVKEAFKATNRTCVVQPMGCGKSYVALQWIQENLDKKILYLTSYNSIKRQISNLLETEIQAINVDILTYSGILKRDISGYDMIVLDEFHRIGAEKWGAAVKKILEFCPNAKILGLSATPIRYLDNKRDMAEELFHGNVAWEMTLAEAITTRGILPMPKYVTCLYSMQEEFNRAQERVSKIKYVECKDKAKRLLNRAKSYLEQSKGLEEVFEEHIINKSGRYLVFCKDIEHMNTMVDESKNWFKSVNKNVHTYIVFSDIGAKASEQEINAFEDDNSDALKLLFCVNMFNEGYHLEGIAGAILLRPTESPNIYLQQIGRCLSASVQEQPLIIDVVDNAACLRNSEGLAYEINNLINMEGSEFNSSFRIYAEMQDFISALTELETFSWYFYFDKYKEYLQDKATGKKVILSHEIKVWLKLQKERHERGNLPEDKVKLLESIGCDLSIKHPKSWNDWFELFKCFIEEFGVSKLTSKTTYKDEELGHWWNYQRYLYIQGKMSFEKIEKFKSIALDLSKACKSREVVWYDNLMALEYFIINDVLPQEFNLNEEQLISWARNRSSEYFNDKLTPERKAAWEDMRSRVDISKLPTQRELNWQDNFDILSRYVMETGNLGIPVDLVYEGENIGKWFSNQLERDANGILAKDRAEKFKELGVFKVGYKRSTRIRAEEQILEYLTECKDKFGTLDIPRMVRYKNKNVYYFNRRLRNNRKAGKLSDNLISELDKLGFVWDKQAKK